MYIYFLFSFIDTLPSALYIAAIVKYIVQSPGHDPVTVIVAVPIGATAQNVMEAGANSDKSLQFVATYYSAELGYFINKIGQVGEDLGMSWMLYWAQGVGEPQKAKVGVSHFKIINKGYSIILRYERY